jgi:signal transduction histidine kinase
MKLATIVFFILLCNGGFAQQKNIDSLIAISKTGTPEKRVDAYNALCDALTYDKPAQAKLYAFTAIELAKNIQYKSGFAGGYNRLGVVYDISGKYDSSVYCYEIALKLFDEISDLKGRGSANNNVGLIYWNQGNTDKALSYFFKALADFESIKNDKYIANALNNIGLVYDDLMQYRKSLEYHYKALKVYEKLNDYYLIGAACTNIGNCYSELQKIDSSKTFYLRAIDMHTKADDDYGLSFAYNGYAGILYDKADYNKSLLYFKKALELKNKLDEKVGQSSVILQMSSVYNKMGNATLELQCLNQAKEIAEKNDFKKDLISIYKKLSSFYESTDKNVSLAFYKKFEAVKDSVFNETSNKQIAELNAKYETSKKEQQLALQKRELGEKNALLVGAGFALILIVLLSFLFYRKRALQNKVALQGEVLKQQDIATKAIIEAEENERKRIAAELHDGVGQMMSVAKMNLSAFENDLPFASDVQRKNFENVIALVDESCKEVRNVSHQMMPNALLKSGLANAVREFISKIDNHIIKVTLHSEGLNERLDGNLETVLYRVIQECVNNVLKHANANHLDISIIKDEEGIAATIEDNGNGFDTSRRDQMEGIGLKNIVSRVTYLKGTIDFSSEKGKGTLIAIHIPH